jgi:hypothetical protein
MQQTAIVPKPLNVTKKTASPENKLKLLVNGESSSFVYNLKTRTCSGEFLSVFGLFRSNPVHDTKLFEHTECFHHTSVMKMNGFAFLSMD